MATLSGVTDDDASSTLTYSFFPTTSYTHFKFNTGTPNQIDLKALIDLDAGTADPAQYTLNVIVTDGGAPSSRTGSTVVLVTVNAQNQHTPTFSAVSAMGVRIN